mmetsp:Transcript_65519/g.116238  ORF Transcript_65519/g.116238 Transcript_65519/m.116238 type:complete len:239 (+) Transcript_65519:77-793(+)
MFVSLEYLESSQTASDCHTMLCPRFWNSKSICTAGCGVSVPSARGGQHRDNRLSHSQLLETLLERRDHVPLFCGENRRLFVSVHSSSVVLEVYFKPHLRISGLLVHRFKLRVELVQLCQLVSQLWIQQRFLRRFVEDLHIQPACPCPCASNRRSLWTGHERGCGLLLCYQGSLLRGLRSSLRFCLCLSLRFLLLLFCLLFSRAFLLVRGSLWQRWWWWWRLLLSLDWYCKWLRHHLGL